MYTNNRDAYRQAFFITWQKYQQKLPLEAVEAQLVEVILLHPEYHALLDKPADYQAQEFALGENPFLHMSLHLSVHEQVKANRPDGIAEIYRSLVETYGDKHDVLHRMMECLAKMMWEAQASGIPPSESEYLKKLQALSPA